MPISGRTVWFQIGQHARYRDGLESSNISMTTSIKRPSKLSTLWWRKRLSPCLLLSCQPETWYQLLYPGILTAAWQLLDVDHVKVRCQKTGLRNDCRFISSQSFCRVFSLIFRFGTSVRERTFVELKHLPKVCVDCIYPHLFSGSGIIWKCCLTYFSPLATKFKRIPLDHTESFSKKFTAGVLCAKLDEFAAIYSQPDRIQVEAMHWRKLTLTSIGEQKASDQKLEKSAHDAVPKATTSFQTAILFTFKSWIIRSQHVLQIPRS